MPQEHETQHPESHSVMSHENSTAEPDFHRTEDVRVAKTIPMTPSRPITRPQQHDGAKALPLFSVPKRGVRNQYDQNEARQGMTRRAESITGRVTPSTASKTETRDEDPVAIDERGAQQSHHGENPNAGAGVKRCAKSGTSAPDSTGTRDVRAHEECAYSPRR